MYEGAAQFAAPFYFTLMGIKCFIISFGSFRPAPWGYIFIVSCYV